MTNRKHIVALAVAGILASSAIVLALVTFDPSTGTGFVGKGDVQTAFGWNNAQLQARAGGVTFSYSQTINQTVVCHDGGSTNVQSQKTGTRIGTVGSAIAYNARTHQQIDGFLLTGLGSSTTTNVSFSNGDPSDGAFQACVTNFPNNLDITDNGSGPLALYVTYGGTTVQLTY